MKSRVDGSVHRISPATARGTVNTYKFEGAEVAQEPLLQIFLIGSELFFEFTDSARPLGHPVLKFLEAGFDTDPLETVQTTSDRDRATWYRFV